MVCEIKDMIACGGVEELSEFSCCGVHDDRHKPNSKAAGGASYVDLALPSGDVDEDDTCGAETRTTVAINPSPSSDSSVFDGIHSQHSENKYGSKLNFEVSVKNQTIAITTTKRGRSTGTKMSTNSSDHSAFSAVAADDEAALTPAPFFARGPRPMELEFPSMESSTVSSSSDDASMDRSFASSSFASSSLPLIGPPIACGGLVIGDSESVISNYDEEDENEKTPLFSAIQEEDWENVFNFLTTNEWGWTSSNGPIRKIGEKLVGLKPLASPPASTQVRTWVVYIQEDVVARGGGQSGGTRAGRRTPTQEVCKRRYRQLPIHAAILHQAPIAVIYKLIAMFPNSLQLPSSPERNYPLHLAFYVGAKLPLLKLLLEKYPGSINKRNANNLLPEQCSYYYGGSVPASVSANSIYRHRSGAAVYQSGLLSKELDDKFDYDISDKNDLGDVLRLCIEETRANVTNEITRELEYGGMENEKSNVIGKNQILHDAKKENYPYTNRYDAYKLSRSVSFRLTDEQKQKEEEEEETNIVMLKKYLEAERRQTAMMRSELFQTKEELNAIKKLAYQKKKEEEKEQGGGMFSNMLPSFFLENF